MPANTPVPVIGYGQPTADGGLAKYTDCKVYPVGSGPTPVIGDAGNNPGLNNLDVNHLRCYFLTTKLGSVAGNTTILNIDNFTDCRIDVVPDVSAILAEATAKFSGSKYDQGAFGRLAADIEDANTAGSDVSGITSIMQMVGNMPRQGTMERNGLEAIRSATVQSLRVVAEMLASKTKAWGVDSLKIMSLLEFMIDLAFNVGDYVSEFMAARNEAAARFYSGQRRETISDGFERIYGVKPSLATVGAWCRYGNSLAFETDDASAYLAAPGDEKGKFTEKANRLKAISRVIDDDAGALASRFKNDWRRFFGLSSLLGCWTVMYDQNELDDAGDVPYGRAMWEAAGGKPEDYDDDAGTSLYELLSNAATKGSNDSLWTTAGDGDQKNRNQIVRRGQNDVIKVLNSTDKADPDAYRPFWADRGDSDGVTDNNRRREMMTRAIIWFWDGYPPKIKWDENVWGKYQTMTHSPRLGQGFAGDMMVVWKFWAKYITRMFPYNGRARRDKELKKFLVENFDRFADISYGNPKATADRLNSLPGWAPKIIWATTGMVEQTVPKASSLRPSADSPPCPKNKFGEETGTSCLPCDAIRDRLPIGAKAFPIPMLIEFSGNSPRQSKEFKAWSQKLRTNGYPDFYIDCLARDAKWVGKGGRVYQYAKSGKFQTISVASGVAAQNAIKEQGRASKQLAGVVGLTASRIATLGLVPPPVMPELQGITRPLMIEALPSQKKQV